MQRPRTPEQEAYLRGVHAAWNGEQSEAAPKKGVASEILAWFRGNQDGQATNLDTGEMVEVYTLIDGGGHPLLDGFGLRLLRFGDAVEQATYPDLPALLDAVEALARRAGVGRVRLTKRVTGGSMRNGVVTCVVSMSDLPERLTTR